MKVTDRRIKKSQDAIKKAVVELMGEKGFDSITIQDIADKADVSRGTVYHHYLDKYDLLDKIIDEHIQNMRDICEASSELEYIDANQPWFDYLAEHYLFFSTMLASKSAPTFRTKFLGFLEEEFQDEINVEEGKNEGLSSDVLLQFIVTSYVGMVEWWIKKKMPYPPSHMAQQVGLLLDRNL